MHDQLIQSILSSFSQLKRSMRAYAVNVSLELGITPAQLEMLYMLKNHQPVTHKQLAGQLQLTPGAVSQLLDGLASNNYIMRSDSQDDRRVHYLALSPSGEKTIATYNQTREAIIAKALSEVTDEDLRRYLHVQQALMNQFEITITTQGEPHEDN